MSSPMAVFSRSIGGGRNQGKGTKKNWQKPFKKKEKRTRYVASCDLRNDSEDVGFVWVVKGKSKQEEAKKTQKHTTSECSAQIRVFLLSLPPSNLEAKKKLGSVR